MEDLKLILNDLKVKLSKIEITLHNPVDLILEECIEIRTKVQLDTEEVIADLKIKNGYEINSDTNDVNEQLQSLIQKINDKFNESMNNIDTFEHDRKERLINLPELLFNKTNEYKEQIDSWFIKIEAQIMTRQFLRNLKRQMSDMNEHLDDIFYNLKNCIFQNISLEYKKHNEDYHGSGYVFINETIDFKTLNHSNEKIIQKNSEFGILGDSLILIVNKIGPDTNLVTYDLTTSTKINEQVLEDFDFFKMRVVNEFAVLQSIKNMNRASTTIVIDKQLKIIKRLQFEKYFIFLIGANESFIYLKSFTKEGIKILTFDWSLNKVKFEFKNQLKNVLEEGHIRHFEIENDMIVVYTSFNEISIYYKDGKSHTIIRENSNNFKVKSSMQNFVIDSNKNIVFKSDNVIKFFDLDGTLIKRINLINFQKQLIPPVDFKFFINRKNEIFFYHENEDSYLYHR